MEHNGGSIAAMVGEQCVGIISDLRLGQNMTTVANNFSKLFEITESSILGLAGLATDVLTVYFIIY